LYFDQREQLRWFATLSRGYKAGGFNIGEASRVQTEFLPEYLVGLDVGMKAQWLDERLYTDVTAFYMKRTDMQVAISTQLDPIGDPSSYLLYTDNASGGRNLGIESSVRWRATAQLELGGALGLLRTRYSGFRPDGINEASDRDQAYAPEYQASVNATWRHPLGWMARFDVIATDDFYFDVPENNIRSKAYSLTHLKAGYEADNWAVYAWGRNVLDEDYYTRGFFFGNEPPDFAPTRYTQLGEPRQFGVTFRWEFK
jgi:outer membrane receptor protein involved in Fe transport